jgi:hypothetical protein
MAKRSLPIRSVCPEGERWEDMARADGGRRCLRCAAHLLDLSTLTEAQVDDLRRVSRAGDGVCAKVSLDSEGAPIYRQTAVRRLVQTAAGVVMSVSLAACGEPDGVTVTPLAPRATEATVEPEREKPQPEKPEPEVLADCERAAEADSEDGTAHDPSERRRVRHRGPRPDEEERLILGFID